jgi:predicted TIM-barrel fold metal-dependent hydrolase
MLNELPLFDSHLHIIDKRYPLNSNNGYLPNEFTGKDYLSAMSSYCLLGGAIVSGSFQGFDQTYLINALETLGPSFVGVTQLPFNVSDAEIIYLNSVGVRAVRFNLKRGGSAEVVYLPTMAARIYELVGWHVELYVDSAELPQLHNILVNLPLVSIDHLGLSRAGMKPLLTLVEKGIRVKATGFGRVDFDIKHALKEIYSVNPGALMFGTDSPSTRAPRPYSDSDFFMVAETLGIDAAKNVFSKNAISFYKPELLLAAQIQASIM